MGWSALLSSEETRQTPWGKVDVKVCSGYGVTREKPEFAQVAEIAEAQGLSIRDIKEKI